MNLDRSITELDCLFIDPDLFTLDALRFGLVPSYNIAKYTMNYDRYKIFINASLPNDGNSHLLNTIEGPFGSGKSHTLALVTDISKEQGYLISKVDFTKEAVCLSRPYDFFHSILSGIEGKDIDRGFPLFSLFTRKINKSTQKIPKSSFPLLENYRILQNIDINQENIRIIKEYIDYFLQSSSTKFLNYINKNLNFFPDTEKLVGFSSPTAQDKTRVLYENITALGVIARYSGYKGLIITIDEVIGGEDKPDEAVLVVKEMQKGIIQVSQAMTQERVIPGHLGFYFSVVRSPSPLYHALVDNHQKIMKGSIFPLQQGSSHPFSPDETKFLFRNIFQAYKQIYKISGDNYDKVYQRFIEKFDVPQTSSDRTRQLIKQYLYYLDTIYGPP